jgi:hypothetical protein
MIPLLRSLASGNLLLPQSACGHKPTLINTEYSGEETQPLSGLKAHKADPGTVLILSMDGEGWTRIYLAW